MRNFILIGFILALPALSVLGHDVYRAYNNTALQGADRFAFSDVGWLWIHYSPDSYDWAHNTFDADMWNDIIDPVLQQHAFYVAAVPFALFLAIVFFMKLFGLGSFEGRGFFQLFGRTGKSKMKKGDFSFSGAGAKKKAKYKRK